MPNEINVNRGTAITWKVGGTADMSMTSLAAAAGVQGSMHTLPDPGSRVWNWRVYTKFATAPVVGDMIYVYGKTSDGTHYDNDDGATSGSVSAEDKLRNLTLMGVLIVDEASSTPEFSTSGTVLIDAAQFAPVIWNATADALSSTDADHGFELTPVPDEIQ